MQAYRPSPAFPALTTLLTLRYLSTESSTSGLQIGKKTLMSGISSLPMPSAMAMTLLGQCISLRDKAKHGDVLPHNQVGYADYLCPGT